MRGLDTGVDVRVITNHSINQHLTSNNSEQKGI